jgi:predicted DCC family thiol-disulfide oxidoreductase YuxK
MVLVFLPVGTKLSLDEKILASESRAGSVLRLLYRGLGEPTLEKASILRCAALISYGMLCLYSVLMHTRDEAWMSGLINLYAVTNHYMGKQFEVFRALGAAYPAAFVNVSILSVIGMVIWQLLLMPLVFISRLTKSFTIVWGILFFSVAIMFLNLQWLSYYEFVLWAMIFWQVWMLNVDSKKTVAVLYDDHCNLCHKTVTFLRFVDLFSVVELAPLSQNLQLAERHGIDTEKAYNNLYGISRCDDRVYVGYDLYWLLFKRIFLLCPLYPVMLIGRITGIGPLVYRYIAARRIELFGVCPITRGAEPSARAGTPRWQSEDRQNLFKAFLLSYAILLISFAFTLPYIRDVLPRELSLWAGQYKSPHQLYGFTPIDVFNDTDIRMTERYFTIFRMESDGTRVLLPFTGEDGRRLKWHESDRIYFGNSLPWRRGRLHLQNRCFERSFDSPFVRELIRLDQNLNNSLSRRYQLDYYYEPIPDLTLLRKRIYEQKTPTKVCTVGVGLSE